MTPTLADEIEALAKEATPGPWRIGGYDEAVQCGYNRSSRAILGSDGTPVIICDPSMGEYSEALDPDHPDAALIVSLVNNAPAIVSALREVSALKEEVERLRGALLA